MKAWNAPKDLGPLFRPAPENRHPNSAIALQKLAEEGTWRTRKIAIAHVLDRLGPRADREIQEALGLRERNDVSGRISDMKKQRFVVEVGSKVIGGHPSRIVSLTAAGLAWLQQEMAQTNSGR